MAKSLTPDRVKGLSKRPGMHLDEKGLYLQVTSNTGNGASWVYRYMLRGNARMMGLGSYPSISLYTARSLADAARAVRAAGQDPIEARESERAARALAEAHALTFREAAEAYLKVHEQGWRSTKHAKQWRATLEAYVMPTLGDLPLSGIDTALVTSVLDPIWWTKPETASRIRGRIEAILDWATGRGYRSGPNPAAWKGNLSAAYGQKKRSKIKPVKHHAALPYKQLPTFLADLAGNKAVATQAMLFTILTAARTGETIAAQWPEVSFETGIWTIPAERMKAKKEHRVPLSAAAIKILKHQHKETGGKGYVFPGLKQKSPISNMAMLKLLERIGRDDLTVHGFRSSFRDWAEEETAFSQTVTEAALAHTIRDKVEAAYRRGDLFQKRKALMDQWARFCMAPKAAENVVTFKKSGK